MTEILLEINDLTVKFPNVTALKSLSLKISKGEYIALVGPTGAGKTTLLKTIAGLEIPESGNIIYKGQNITKLAPEDRKIAFMPQDYSLFPKMTVLQNTSFSPEVNNIPEEDSKKLVMALLAMVKLDQRTKAVPKELSGGMQQRLALARSLASNYDLILLDEPLRALDARLRLELRKELRKLADDLQKTIIHVTHDQDEAFSVGEKLIILNKGQIEQFSDPLSCYRDPKNMFVNFFLGEVNFLRGRILSKSDEYTEVLVGKETKIICEKTDIQIDSQVLIGIQPEHIVITRKPKQIKNSFRTKIINKRFMGKWTDLTLEIKDSLDKVQMRTRSPSMFVPKFFRENIRITAYWKPENANLFEYQGDLKKYLGIV